MLAHTTNSHGILMLNLSIVKDMKWKTYKKRLVIIIFKVCMKCCNGNPTGDNAEKVMLAGCNLEVVDRFCYQGDMLDAGGGAESSIITRVRSGRKRFRELLPLFTTKATSLKVRGDLYASCECSVVLYGSETWPVNVVDSQRLHRNEMSMIRWMCGVTQRQVFQ